MKFIRFFICFILIMMLVPNLVIADDFDEPTTFDISTLTVSADGKKF